MEKIIDGKTQSRRTFFGAAAATVCGSGMLFAGNTASAKSVDSIHVLGPQEGFTPHIGTMLSMMTWMRSVVVRTVQGMTTKDLDFLLDKNANSIGAMLLHLAATERIYQLQTFEWDEPFDNDGPVKWDAAMSLGDKGRNLIKGNSLDYYLDVLAATRQKTIDEFRKRNDEWLLKAEEHGFQNQPTNNYCKWFHVCEHESNHNGQIKLIRGRLPGAKNSGD